MRVTNRRPRAKLSVDDTTRIIHHAAQQGFQAVSFTGGEPFLYLDEVVSLIDVAGRAGIPYIRTGTNGFLFRRSELLNWEGRVRRMIERLAATPLRNLWISIDSANPRTHESMRGLPGVIAGIERAIPLFHEAGIYPSANLGINRCFGLSPLPCLSDCPTRQERESFRLGCLRGLDAFFGHVLDMGFTMVNMCYPMSHREDPVGDSHAVYGATSSDPIVRFSRIEKALLFEALFEIIPRYRHQLRIFTPLASVYSLWQAAERGVESRHACRGGADFFFVDCTGHTYPCGYRGSEPLGPFHELSLPVPNEAPKCTACEWECFRDPSELGGAFIEAAARPFSTTLQVLFGRKHTPLWLQDMRYYRACRFFDGRRPLSEAGLRRFRDVPPLEGHAPETQPTVELATEPDTGLCLTPFDRTPGSSRVNVPLSVRRS
jgi:hypothetical protein